MNNIKNKLIEMLGENVNIEDINNYNVANNMLCGKFKFNNLEIQAYIIEKKDLKNKKKFEGKIVGIIEIQDTKELRMVVSPINSKISYQEITGYFKNIEGLKNAKYSCLYEKSAGVIAYELINKEPHYLIIYSDKNIPGFPKGHIEYGEKEEEAAKRELFEEVGVKADLRENFRESIYYTVVDTPIQKEVVFFLGEMEEEQSINININEISKFEIVTFDEAKKILNKELINVLKRAKKYIDKKSK